MPRTIANHQEAGRETQRASSEKRMLGFDRAQFTVLPSSSQPAPGPQTARRLVPVTVG